MLHLHANQARRAGAGGRTAIGSASRLSVAPRFTADARSTASDAPATVPGSSAAIVAWQRPTLATASFRAHAAGVLVSAAALACRAACRIVVPSQMSRVIVQQRVTGGEDGDGAERQ